jgi:hypothetical protein
VSEHSVALWIHDCRVFWGSRAACGDGGLVGLDRSAVPPAPMRVGRGSLRAQRLILLRTVWRRP